MQLSKGKPWYTATALWDITQLAPGYYTIAIRARDEIGAFSKEIEVKVTEEEIVPVGELILHFDAYQGHYTSIKGIVSFVALGEPFAEAGSGAIVIMDETGSMVIIVGECISPLPPTLASGDLVMVKGVPLKFSWELIETNEDSSIIEEFAPLLPKGLLVTDEAGRKEVKVVRLLAGDDVQKSQP